MCSGCSGDFEGDGDWELSDSYMADCDPEEFWSYLRERRRLWGQRVGLPDAAEGMALDPEDYEVLVSADRIVERRVVRAKSFVVSAVAASVADGPWSESLRERERSQPRCAKDYRTLTISRIAKQYSSDARRNWLQWRYLGAATIAVLMLWAATR